MDYYTYGYNKNPSYYNYCDSSSSSMQNNNFSEMKCLEKKKKKKHTSGSKEVRLSTDPQSVAARERRHRISERFKILQSLVPGGTKMDTVTMLEEAILYVKFLKTQIWWLNQHHQSQSQYQDINFNNIINDNHVVVDDVYEQPSANFNDHLTCDDLGQKQMSTNYDIHGKIYLQDNYNYNYNYDYHPIMPGQQALGYQDSWFQMEDVQQSMDFDDVTMESW